MHFLKYLSPFMVFHASIATEKQASLPKIILGPKCWLHPIVCLLIDAIVNLFVGTTTKECFPCAAGFYSAEQGDCPYWICFLLSPSLSISKNSIWQYVTQLPPPYPNLTLSLEGVTSFPTSPLPTHPQRPIPTSISDLFCFVASESTYLTSSVQGPFSALHVQLDTMLVVKVTALTANTITLQSSVLKT